jgi:CRISPR/Cas system-associated protein Cas5 (RAMP superfamily)
LQCKKCYRKKREIKRVKLENKRSKNTSTTMLKKGARKKRNPRKMLINLISMKFQVVILMKTQTSKVIPIIHIFFYSLIHNIDTAF